MNVLRTVQVSESLYTTIYFLCVISIAQDVGMPIGILLLVCCIYNSLGIFFYEFDGINPPKDYDSLSEINQIKSNKLFHSYFVILCSWVVIFSDDSYLDHFAALCCCADVFLSDKNVKLYSQLSGKEQND